jgi:hypothetical protein
MEHFYQQAESRRKLALIEQQRTIQKQWFQCVENASRAAIPLEKIECHVDYRPDRSTIEELESETVKLHYYDANRDTRRYGGPNTTHIPEVWFIKVREPAKPVWNPN